MVPHLGIRPNRVRCRGYSSRQIQRQYLNISFNGIKVRERQTYPLLWAKLAMTSHEHDEKRTSAVYEGRYAHRSMSFHRGRYRR